MPMPMPMPKTAPKTTPTRAPRKTRATAVAAIPSEQPSATQSLDRALRLLEHVVAHARAGVALPELAQLGSLSKPTAHRLMAGLRNAGLVDYNAVTRHFAPSFKLYRQIRAAIQEIDLIASGGVASIADIDELERIGCSGVIVGKALYEQTIKLEDLAKYAG